MKGDNLITMSVSELIVELQQFDGDELVVFQYDYGDHHHTQAVGGINVAEVRPLEESAYSHSGWAIKEDDDCDEADRDDDDEEEGDAPETEGPHYVVLAGS